LPPAPRMVEVGKIIVTVTLLDGHEFESIFTGDYIGVYPVSVAAGEHEVWIITASEKLDEWFKRIGQRGFVNVAPGRHIQSALVKEINVVREDFQVEVKP
jgi:hypothetical protein